MHFQTLKQDKHFLITKFDWVNCLELWKDHCLLTASKLLKKLSQTKMYFSAFILLFSHHQNHVKSKLIDSFFGVFLCSEMTQRNTIKLYSKHTGHNGMFNLVQLFNGSFFTYLKMLLLVMTYPFTVKNNIFFTEWRNYNYLLTSKHMFRFKE